MRGLIHIYEGDGKGKTTAAVGLSVRCAGNGGRVLFTQFLKDGSSSEITILKQIKGIDVFSATRKLGFVFRMNEEEKEQAKDYYCDYFDQMIEKVQSGQYNMLVLDEIMAAYNLNMIEKQKLCDFLANKPEKLEVIMTGRDPADEITAFADYQSNICKVKHPFDNGVAARDGIEQ